MSYMDLLLYLVLLAALYRIVVLEKRLRRPGRNAWMTAERRKVTGDPSVEDGKYVETRCLIRGDPGYYETRLIVKGEVVEDHFFRSIKTAVEHHDNLVRANEVLVDEGAAPALGD